MNSKLLKSGLLVAALALAAYWYWSPLLTLRQMKSAAVRHDADTFNNYVNYPRVRESLKGQFSALIAAETVQRHGGDVSAADAGATLGAVFGVMMVDRVVDALVRPEAVMHAMQEGRLAGAGQPPASPSPSDKSSKGDTPRWVGERKGVDKYVVSASTPGDLPQDRVSLVFERSGFAHWALTEVRMPTVR
jgi:hypothetical protein